MNTLEQDYQELYTRFLLPVAEKLEANLKTHLIECRRIDRICTRAKSITRFMKKALKQENGGPKYDDPLNQIQDQIGARIVTFYSSDVSRIAEIIKRYFRPIENKILVPDSENEFGYVGQHFILFLPSDITAEVQYDSKSTTFFELQIKTLFQHSWAEAEHDLGYKNSTHLTPLQKRKLAFTAAQAWGADQIFDEMFQELNS